MAYKEIFRHVKELSTFFPKRIPVEPDPLGGYDLETGPLPIGISEADYWISRNSMFNEVFISRLRVLRAQNSLLTKDQLDNMLTEWETHTGICIKPRHLYDFACLNIVPGCSPKGYTEPDYYNLNKIARDNLRKILIEQS